MASDHQPALDTCYSCHVSLHFKRYYILSERFYYKNVRITVTQKISKRAAAIDTLNNIL